MRVEAVRVNKDFVGGGEVMEELAFLDSFVDVVVSQEALGLLLGGKNCTRFSRYAR